MLTTSLILRPQTWAEKFDWKIAARRDSSSDSEKVTKTQQVSVGPE